MYASSICDAFLEKVNVVLIFDQLALHPASAAPRHSIKRYLEDFKDAKILDTPAPRFCPVPWLKLTL